MFKAISNLIDNCEATVYSVMYMREARREGVADLVTEQIVTEEMADGLDFDGDGDYADLREFLEANPKVAKLFNSGL